MECAGYSETFGYKAAQIMNGWMDVHPEELFTPSAAEFSLNPLEVCRQLCPCLQSAIHQLDEVEERDALKRSRHARLGYDEMTLMDRPLARECQGMSRNIKMTRRTLWVKLFYCGDSTEAYFRMLCGSERNFTPRMCPALAPSAPGGRWQAAGERASFRTKVRAEQMNPIAP